MLSEKQLRQTSVEMNENLQISGLTKETVCADLNISSGALNAVLAMSHEDPTTVWRVRDYLVKKIEEQGKEPMRFSALKRNIWYRYDQN